MPKIVPCLWFDGLAEEAAQFYTSIFKNSRIGDITYYTEGMFKPKGEVLTVQFFLDGQEYTALNGGSEFKFSEAISLEIHCADQAEVDDYWDKLLAGGEATACGWLKDKYGVSWQVVPEALYSMLLDPDPKRVQRVIDVMLKMVKLELAPLQQAYDAG